MDRSEGPRPARFESLTIRNVEARAIVLKLKRPVIARIATITEWPLILIDLHTEEGIVGHSYLEPYTPRTMKYLIPALHDLGDVLEGRPVAPNELYTLARKSLHFVGYQGMSMIVVSGLDMAAWDALSKAAGMPLCVLLGGTTGPVPAYNSNGLWFERARGCSRRSAGIARRGRIFRPQAPVGPRKAASGCRDDRGGAARGRRRYRIDG